MAYDISAELARLSQREDEQRAELQRSDIVRPRLRSEMPPLGSRDFWIYWAGFTAGSMEARRVKG